MLDKLEKLLAKYIGQTSSGSLAYDPREVAREVLQALYEPTDEMIEAGHMTTGSWWDIKGSALTVKRVKMKMRWQGMIKEALKDD